MRVGAHRHRRVKTDIRRWPQVAPRPVDLIPAIGVDDKLFGMEKMQAHRSGQLHLAVSVFLFCGDEMLIQRRAIGKYHCGGLWANSCCTHPHWGETLAAAARRRMWEELGVWLRLSAGSTLTYRARVGKGLIEHERVQLFRAEADKTKLHLVPDPNEVMETVWITRQALLDSMAQRPQDYAPWFRIYVSRWDELGLATYPIRPRTHRARAQHPQPGAAE